MNLIETLKSKGLLILCIILSTLLTVSYISGKDDKKLISEIQPALVRHIDLNKKLSDENLVLAKELSEAPQKYIPIVKEVEKEVCNGVVKQELIKALPSRKEDVNEKNTADIDDKLPADLLIILK